jgi:carbon monoxide dehydrogenase subunit G
MKLSHSIDVAAPPGEVWPVLLDLEQVVPCLPGARVVARVDDRTYRAAIGLRVGPMSLSYEGDVHLEEVDEAARRAVLRGEATETRGQGSASASIVLQLSEAGSGTHADIDVDLVLDGRVAQMGGRIVEDVSGRLVAQFAARLSEQLASGRAAPTADADLSPPTAPAPPPADVDIRPVRLLLSVLGARVRSLLRRRRRGGTGPAQQS